MRNLLSFFIALTLALAVFGIYHILKSDEDGVAHASIGGSIGQVVKEQKYSVSQAWRLRRAISQNSEHFLKMRGSDIRAALQAPELIRKDAPVIMWQYRNKSCVLDLYFSSEERDVMNAPIVHYEIRARQKDMPDEAVRNSCLKNLVKSKA